MPTTDEIDGIIRASLPEMQSVIRTAIQDKLKASIGWQLDQQIAEQLKTFIAEEIAPEIATALAAEKGAIVQAVNDAAAGIGEKLRETLIRNAAEALTGYQGREIVSKLVGGR